MARILGALTIALAGALTGNARARAAESEALNPALELTHDRRSGVVLGLAAGAGLAGSSGYPNNANLIDDPHYYAASGFMTGGGGGAFIMGALADYVNFGIWFQVATFTNADFKSTGTGGGFRVEGFPFVRVLPALGDLGVFTQLGLGSTKLTVTKPGAYPTSDGVQSYAGLGVFYEWSFARALGGHLSGGPSVEYDAIFSRSIERHGALAGGRIVFYGGP